MIKEETQQIDKLEIMHIIRAAKIYLRETYWFTTHTVYLDFYILW
jgi:hypothetical protein